MSDEMTVYRVGGLFDPDRTTWPESPHLWMDEEVGVRLGIFVNRPSRQEIAAVDTGRARFAWTEQGLNGFLLFKYGGANWSDAVFNPDRLTEPFDLEPLPRGIHRAVYTFLVDGTNGRIAAMRHFSWPGYFVNTVVESVRRLDAKPGYSEPQARADQADFYKRYPDGPSLYRLTTQLPPEAKCEGGQRDDKPF